MASGEFDNLGNVSLCDHETPLEIFEKLRKHPSQPSPPPPHKLLENRDASGKIEINLMI